jgi:type II secretory pathway component GspD/PulD (secretin)
VPQNPIPSRRSPLILLAAMLALPAAAQDQPPAEDEAMRQKLEQQQQEQQKEQQKAEQQAQQGKEPATKGVVLPPTGATGATGLPGSTGPTGAHPATGPARIPGLNTPPGQPKVPITVSGGTTPGQSGTSPAPLRPDEISLSNFADGLDIKALVEYVANTLQINVVAADSLQGTVVLNAPVVVKKSELLGLLDALLEQHGFTIIPDSQTGFYKVIPIDGVQVVFDPELSTTRIIPTPTVRPSALADLIAQHVGGGLSAPGVPGQPQGGARSRINFLDDLGVIVVTDSPRRISTIEQLVNVVLARAAEQQFIRFDLEHLAASTARTRILELVGRSSSQSVFPPGSPQAAQGLAAALNNANFDNLADRLMADAQSNALILRGYPDEEAKIKSLLAILDKPNVMEYKQYFAGSAALQIAQLAERFGFGSVEQVETTASQAQTNPLQPGAVRPQQPQLNQLQFGAPTQQGTLGGPVMVVDPSRGAITYNGTASQQTALEKLISSFNPELEIVEFRAYKIKNMPAVDMSDLLTGLIFNEEVARSDTSNSFLPGSGGGGRGSRREQNSYRNRSDSSRSNRISRQDSQNQNQPSTRNTSTNSSTRPQRITSGAGGRGPIALAPGQPEGEGVSAISPNDVFLLPDEANNQVVVKATARDHEQIAKLINKLDQRRPQVYIEVQIVSVSATDDFRLAFEVQGINAGGSGGAVNTNFGLGTFAGTTTGGTPTNGNFVGPKSVITTLAGMTAAVVRSDQVPIIMTALRRNADTRILSNPQLLVDDNEFAEIVSLDEQPTTGTDVGNSTSLTSFTGYESAGTSLSVLPSISEAGYLRLDYEIELSNFVGTGSAGVPPPKQTRNVSSFVTIPGNATIVVGGIKVDQNGKTIVKVPLLGDIPIVGHLFRDTNKNKITTRLYVFITPRIMRDVNFGDFTLLTRNPAKEAGIPDDTPPLEPIMIELNEKPRSVPLGSGEATAQGPRP